MSHSTHSNDPLTMNRREAIKRTALMLGAAVSSTTIAGCLGEDRSQLGPKPQFLSEAQAKLVSAAADMLLPATDSVGALDVGVPELIDVLFGKYMTGEEKETFTSGLSALEADGFAGKAPDAQQSALATLAKTNRKFVSQLRGAIITGYFTSEEVCKNVTHYDPVPGAYVGCVPIAETGNVIMSEPR